MMEPNANNVKLTGGQKQFGILLSQISDEMHSLFPHDDRKPQKGCSPKIQ